MAISLPATYCWQNPRMLLRTLRVFDFRSDGENRLRAFEGSIDNDVEYLAPENNSGSTPDQRSDVYSIGIMLYEMLTGDVPFKGETATDVKIKHAEDAPPALSYLRDDLTPGVEPMVMKALSKRSGTGDIRPLTNFRLP